MREEGIAPANYIHFRNVGPYLSLLTSMRAPLGQDVHPVNFKVPNSNSCYWCLVLFCFIFFPQSTGEGVRMEGFWRREENIFNCRL